MASADPGNQPGEGGILLGGDDGSADRGDAHGDNAPAGERGEGASAFHGFADEAQVVAGAIVHRDGNRDATVEAISWASAIILPVHELSVAWLRCSSSTLWHKVCGGFISLDTKLTAAARRSAAFFYSIADKQLVMREVPDYSLGRWK